MICAKCGAQSTTQARCSSCGAPAADHRILGGAAAGIVATSGGSGSPPVWWRDGVTAKGGKHYSGVYVMFSVAVYAAIGIGVLIAIIVSASKPENLADYSDCSTFVGRPGVSRSARCVEDGHLVDWTSSRSFDGLSDREWDDLSKQYQQSQ